MDEILNYFFSFPALYIPIFTFLYIITLPYIADYLSKYIKINEHTANELYNWHEVISFGVYMSFLWFWCLPLFIYLIHGQLDSICEVI